MTVAAGASRASADGKARVVSDDEVRGHAVAPETLPRRLWLVTLVLGVVLWAAVTVAIALTDDTILVPNLILLGSFLVPVCTVLFVLGRPREAHLSVEAVILGFLAGGTAGLVLTGTTEVYVLPDHFGTNALIGLIEESGKALVLVGVAALVVVRVPRDGMVLGATVGAGYSAFESAGYALGALIQYTDDRPVLNVLQTEAERASLAPFGHIAWTAILGGAIFASAWSDRPLPSGSPRAVDVPRRGRAARLLGRIVWLRDPDQRGPRRRGLADRLARHRRLGRHADRDRSAPLPGRLRRPPGDPLPDRPRLGDPPLAPLPDRSLVRGPPEAVARRRAPVRVTAIQYGRGRAASSSINARTAFAQSATSSSGS